MLILLDVHHAIASPDISLPNRASARKPASVPSETRRSPSKSTNPRKGHSEPRKARLEEIEDGSTKWIAKSGLGDYITAPESQENVLSSDKNFVLVKDKYPKAAVHLLIIPRDSTKSTLHPLDAMLDQEFLAQCKEEAEKARATAATMLRDRTCTDRPDLLEHDWKSDIMVGIHSRPSMKHLHIHVISRDLHSDCLIEPTNYTSFTTSFFVRLDEFPLAEGELDSRQRAIEIRSMKCWRCAQIFRSFTRLKEHLGDEFDEWKQEVSRSGQSSVQPNMSPSPGCERPSTKLVPLF